MLLFSMVDGESKIYVPIKAILIQRTILLLHVVTLKNIIPIINVKIGVSAFSIPATDESKKTCDLANKIAGITVPIKLTISKGIICDFLILCRLPNNKGDRIKNAITSLKQPTSR